MLNLLLLLLYKLNKHFKFFNKSLFRSHQGHVVNSWCPYFELEKVQKRAEKSATFVRDLDCYTNSIKKAHRQDELIWYRSIKQSKKFTVQHNKILVRENVKSFLQSHNFLTNRIVNVRNAMSQNSTFATSIKKIIDQLMINQG